MATPIRMLRLSKGMSTGEVLEWLKSPGDQVEAGEPLLSVLSDKVDVQVEAPASGMLLDVEVPAGEEVSVGTVLGWIGELDEVVEGSDLGQGARAPEAETGGGSQSGERVDTRPEFAAPSGRVKASPVARRLAAQHGISLTSVEGSGPQGIVTKSDVEQVIREGNAPEPGDEGVEDEGVERMPLEGIRKAMAERMVRSKRTAADVTTVVDVDMGAVRALREHVPVTFTSVVVKAAALGLRQHAILNASLEGDEILLHKRIHIGVAVDTPRGLTVVTVADADGMSLRQVDEELRRLSEASKKGGLRIADTQSPTFTVTNSGVFGTLMFTPIINPPQSAVLGMGRVQETPVVRQGEIIARPVMYLCLTYDHRIVEGAEAVRFVREVKACLEDPVRMM